MNKTARVPWDHILAVIAIAAVLGLYAWTDRAANGLAPATGTAEKYDYYNHLVHGFLQGHLYLDVEVPAALKALPDPYDPAANRDIGLIDTSYYGGHYYLYFGPAPAVTLMLPFRAITGVDLPTGWAILVFVTIGFVVLAALWLALRRRYFPAAATWTAPAGVLALGFGCMVGTVLRRPLFWELAVAGGFAFSVLALGAVYRAIHDSRPARWIAAAGVLLGLAIASRPTYAFAAPILLVPVIHRWHIAERARLLAAAIIPLGVAVFALLAYNDARFGRPLEFGHNYQLSVAYEAKVHQLSSRYFGYNLRLYYLLPARWSWQPPYVAPTPTPLSERPPGFYTVDEVYGLLAVFPFTCLALFAPLALTGRSNEERRRLGAALAAPALLYVGVGGVLLFFVAAVARYMVDFVPALMLLAAVGMLAIEARVRQPWRRRTAQALVLLLAAWTVLSGTLVNFELGHALPRTHPEFMRTVTAAVSRLESGYDRLLGRHFGPVEVTLRLPAAPAPHTETLFRTGTAPEQDGLLIEYLADHRARFGVQHGTISIRWSAPAAVSDGSHQLRVDLGSFYPRLAHRFFAGVDHERATALTHRINVVLDGNSVLDAADAFYPTDTGAPRCMSGEFSGAVLNFHGVPPERSATRAASLPDLVLHVPVRSVRPGERLPLLASGRNGAGDMLFLEWVDARHARLGYDHWAAPLVFSPVFPLEASLSHNLALRQDENHWAPPLDTMRLLLVQIDGTLVWRQTVAAYGCTSDQVFIGRNANGHSNCAPQFPGLTAEAAASASRSPGGSLLIRLVLPPGVKGAWLPLLSIGKPGAADAFSIYYIDVNAIEVRFDHRGSPLLLSRRVELGPLAGHDVEFFLPSFAVDHYGHETDGEFWVRWDGVEAMRGQTPAFGFGPGELVLGERPPGTTITEETLDAAVVSQEWLN